MTVSRTISAEDRAAFIRRLADEQGLARGQAEELADKVLAGPDDIAGAAVDWARAGRMPDRPEVLGESPAALSERFTPSQVFTGLMLLRSDPHTARRVLARGVDRRRHTPSDEATLLVSANDTATREERSRPPFLSLGRPALSWPTGYTVFELLLLFAAAALVLSGAVSASVGVALVALAGALLVLRQRT